MSYHWENITFVQVLRQLEITRKFYLPWLGLIWKHWTAISFVFDKVKKGWRESGRHCAVQTLLISWNSETSFGYTILLIHFCEFKHSLAFSRSTTQEFNKQVTRCFLLWFRISFQSRGLIKAVHRKLIKDWHSVGLPEVHTILNQKVSSYAFYKCFIAAFEVRGIAIVCTMLYYTYNEPTFPQFL